MTYPADYYDRFHELRYWILERWNMLVRKEAGQKFPFSDDRIMAHTRWCNVHRENDRVTKWIAENWRNKNSGSPMLVPAMVLARLVNWPDTLEEIGYPHVWDPDHVKSVIRRRIGEGDKVWSSAYIVSTCGRPMAKEDYVVDLVLGGVVQRSWDSWFDDTWNGTLDGIHVALKHTDGLGSFLAAQVVADLKNTPGHPAASANDWKEWSAPGPGSLKGLSILVYGEEGRVTEKTYHQHLSEYMPPILAALPDCIPPIHAQDFQNCLCEYSKFMRVKYGDGRARNKYRPG